MQNKYNNKQLNLKGNDYVNIQSDLRAALAADEFFLCYQPLIDVKSKKMVRMEALLRWKHPQKGLISPADFIPFAENTGLIIPIGEWVLENACKQLKKWHVKGFFDYGISVNVSALQLQHPGFSDFVSNILHRNGLFPKYLELEITESVLLESAHIAAKNIEHLRKQGIKIVLDDFGTGYNSLKYIQDYPIDGIKIDRTFLCNLNTINKAIIDMVISFGHKINAVVTAEGVETKEQCDYLEHQGCDLFQGYYFSKPLMPDELINYLCNPSHL